MPIKFKNTWNQIQNTEHMTLAQQAVESAVAKNKIQPYVAKHMARVAFNTAVLADYSDLTFNQITNVTVGALLHDLGKCNLVAAVDAGNFTQTTISSLKRHHPLISLRQVLKIQGIGNHDIIPAQVALHHTHFNDYNRSYPTHNEINALVSTGTLHTTGVHEARRTGPLLAQSDAFDAFVNCDDPSRKAYMSNIGQLSISERLDTALDIVDKDIVPTMLSPDISAKLVMQYIDQANAYANGLVA